MFNSLSDQDLARLHAKFIVPIVVDQMLHDEETLDDVSEHAMNDLLFDLCPDTALLCLALCARHIAKKAGDFPMGMALGMEAEKITNEYGSLWLVHEKNPNSLNDDDILELLIHIPEDLESLRDLLGATMAALDEDHCTAAILCDILSLQAEHHGNIAELELQNLNLRPQNRDVTQTLDIHQYGGNVIPFPQANSTGYHIARY